MTIIFFLCTEDVKLKTINDFLFSVKMDNVNLFKVMINIASLEN